MSISRTTLRNRYQHEFVGLLKEPKVRKRLEITCGVSRATIWNWNDGVTMPKTWQLKKIRKLFQ
ncbi:MAG: hypothetical protein LBS50_09285 [Prevotellaceae bacterium]|jgi:hypothetical protein|nr:hypothetical protein [Prevotellaceae bacterium]